MTSTNLVTREVVSQACKSIGIRDWSTLTEIEISDDEARAILDEVGDVRSDVHVRTT